MAYSREVREAGVAGWGGGSGWEVQVKRGRSVAYLREVRDEGEVVW